MTAKLNKTVMISSLPSAFVKSIIASISAPKLCAVDSSVCGPAWLF